MADKQNPKSHKVRADQVANLVEAFERFLYAFNWFNDATDSVDKWHAEDRLEYSKIELSQRLAEALGHDNPSKNATDKRPEEAQG